MNNFSRKSNQTNKKNKTLKNRKGGDMFGFLASTTTWGGDSVLVNISLPGDKNLISCSICKNKEFLIRNSTMNKSKLNMALVDFATGDKDNMNGLSDISLISYFCRKCGNAIIVRDPKMSRPNTYTGLIVPTKIGNV